MSKEIEDRLDLLEQRYMVTRERLSKLERIQYQLRDQIGFIQYLSKDPSSQKPIEDRLTEIYQALAQVMDQLDDITVQAPAPVNPLSAQLAAQSQMPIAPQNTGAHQLPPAAIPAAVPTQPATAMPTSPALAHIPKAIPQTQNTPSASNAIPQAPQQHPTIQYKPPTSQSVFIKH